MSQENQNRLIKSIDTALEFSKQQIGFAAILVGLSMALNKDIVPKDAIASKLFLILSWIILIISIVYGLFLIGNLAYELSHEDKNLKDIIEQLSEFGFLQFVFLIAGLVLLMISVIPYTGIFG